MWGLILRVSSGMGYNNNKAAGMDIPDEDIQVLMKLTLLTPTNKPIHAVIPYLKKFCPKVQIRQNTPIFVPLFHTLLLSAGVEPQQETASIDLSPIIDHPSHQHYLNVQTYSASSQQKQGSRYALHVQFAQMIVKSQEANYMEISFRGVQLKLEEQKMKQMRVGLRVAVSHGSSWSGKERVASDLASMEESTTIMFHSLLDTVSLQLYGDKVKLCECKRFVFELIAEGNRAVELQGESVRRAIMKLTSRPSLPIVIID